MIAQFIFIALFLIMWYVGCSIITILAIIVLIYWLPKFIFVKLLELIYPDVITRFKCKNKIAITIDDMPDGNHLNIINALYSRQSKATFFIISGQVNDDNINIFVDAVKQGHQLGNHGRTNSAHFFKSKNELIKEIEDCDTLIKRIYKMADIPLPKTMVYRPGCGILGPEMLSVARVYGYKIALGSVHPFDTIIHNSTINYLYLMLHIKSGDVVVLHDRKWTSLTLHKLLGVLRWSHGIISVTLDELCNT